MSDGSSGNAFGDALESMTTNTKKAIGGTIADFTKSATNQVKGTTGQSSGSFTPGQAPQNPNAAPGLTGGDLFSPDMQGKPKPQGQQTQQSLTQAGQTAASPDTKSPEDMAKIQSIEAELKTMHQKYYQEFLAKAEGRDRKTQMEQEEKAQGEYDEKVKLQQKQEDKKQESAAVFRAKRGSEIKGGMG